MISIKNSNNKYVINIIGSGIAGLWLCKRIKELYPDIYFIRLYEKNNYLGGRLRIKTFMGKEYLSGAEFIHGSKNNIMFNYITKELGISLVKNKNIDSQKEYSRRFIDNEPLTEKQIIKNMCHELNANLEDIKYDVIKTEYENWIYGDDNYQLNPSIVKKIIDDLSSYADEIYLNYSIDNNIVNEILRTNPDEFFLHAYPPPEFIEAMIPSASHHPAIKIFCLFTNDIKKLWDINNSNTSSLLIEKENGLVFELWISATCDNNISIFATADRAKQILRMSKNEVRELIIDTLYNDVGVDRQLYTLEIIDYEINHWIYGYHHPHNSFNYNDYKLYCGEWKHRGFNSSLHGACETAEELICYLQNNKLISHSNKNTSYYQTH